MRTGRPPALAFVVLMASFAWTGCGTSLNDALFQTLSAAGRASIDIFLTDLANNLASSSPDTSANADTNGTNGAGDQTAVDTGGEPAIPPDELIPDATAGQASFTSIGCIGCHCDDASGGCALSAPNIRGVTFDMINARLRGTVTHPIKPSVTDQDIVNIEAFLGSL